MSVQLLRTRLRSLSRLATLNTLCGGMMWEACLVNHEGLMIGEMVVENAIEMKEGRTNTT